MSPSSVPDIATLRQICHGGKLAMDPRPVYVLTRRVSIYLTWLLLHTGMSPNQVTTLTVLLGLLGAVLLGFAGGGWALAGGLAFVSHHLVDKVDGDIARFRKVYSIVGVYLDELGHGLAFGGIFIGLGIHLSWGAEGVGRIAVLTAAAVGGLAMVLGRHHKSIGFQLYAQHVMSRPYLLPSPDPAARPDALSRHATQQARREGGSRGGALALARDLALQLSDFSLMVVLIVIGAVIQIGTGSETVLMATLFGGAALQVAVLLALVLVNVTVNVEAEVRRIDQVARAAHDRPPGREE